MNWIKSIFGLAGGSSVAGWIYAVAGVVLAALLVWAGHALYAAGEASVQSKWDAAVAEDVKQKIDQMIARESVTDEIGNAAAIKLNDIHVQVVTLIKEIPKHVTPEIDARYPLPVALERVWNASALGVDLSAVPLAPGQSDDSPSAARASDASVNIAETNGNYRACREIALGLIDFAERQHALGAR